MLSCRVCRGRCFCWVVGFGGGRWVGAVAGLGDEAATRVGRSAGSGPGVGFQLGGVRVLPNAARQNTTELRRAARRAVARLDPNGAAERHAARKQDRRVELFPLDDAMAELRAYLPAADATRIHRRGRNALRIANTPKNPRTITYGGLTAPAGPPLPSKAWVARPRPALPACHTRCASLITRRRSARRERTSCDRAAVAGQPDQRRRDPQTSGDAPQHLYGEHLSSVDDAEDLRLALTRQPTDLILGVAVALQRPVHLTDVQVGQCPEHFRLVPDRRVGRSWVTPCAGAVHAAITRLT